MKFPMNFLPIETYESLNSRFNKEPECLPIIKVCSEHYRKVGFTKPWIAYFVADQHNTIIGAGGFKGKPIDGKVEISYGTFQKYQGGGVGTEICRQLVLLSLENDPSIKITARTLPENHASIEVLKRNGFKCLGTVIDEEDGAVLEWDFIRKKSNH